MMMVIVEEGSNITYLLQSTLLNLNCTMHLTEKDNTNDNKIKI